MKTRTATLSLAHTSTAIALLALTLTVAACTRVIAQDYYSPAHVVQGTANSESFMDTGNDLVGKQSPSMVGPPSQGQNPGGLPSAAPQKMNKQRNPGEKTPIEVNDTRHGTRNGVNMQASSNGATTDTTPAYLNADLQTAQVTPPPGLSTIIKEYSGNGASAFGASYGGGGGSLFEDLHLVPAPASWSGASVPAGGRCHRQNDDTRCKDTSSDSNSHCQPKPKCKDREKKQCQGSSQASVVSSMPGGFCGPGMGGAMATAAAGAVTLQKMGSLGAQLANLPMANLQQSLVSNSECQASGASCAGESAGQQYETVFVGMQSYLINVANENAGSSTSSHAVSKTYANAVWMVQKMYHRCFLPLAFLFLLPGALLTNIKCMIGANVLGLKDEDCQSPFTGILRSIIAVFLIPTTQLFVSYMIDTGNALESCVAPQANPGIILLWISEQIQTFGAQQQGELVKCIPNLPVAPWRGKLSGMPVAGAIMERMSFGDISMMEIINELFHLLTIGISIISAYQLVLMCYLFCLGPISAAFFAWPSGVGRDLFRKSFSSWLDAVVLLSLWKFWWNIILLCMTIRLQSGGINPFDPFEVFYLIAFSCMFMVIPFNPFEFKASEIVQHALQKAEQQAAKVAQGSGKGSGQGGGKRC